ncbi:MAG: hypothetical protein ACJ735_14690 [Actinomycetes bacterium]
MVQAAAPTRFLRSSPTLRTGVSAQLLATASQLVGFAQLLLLIAPGSSRTTDAYMILFGATQLVVTVWIVGVVYPTHLAEPARAWKHTVACSGAAAAVLAAAGVGFLLALGYPVAPVVGVGTALALSGALAAAAATYSVILACAGRPLSLAGLALLPNVVATAALLATHGTTSTTRTVAMCGALALGNGALCCLLQPRAHEVLSHCRVSQPTPSVVRPRGWLVMAAIVGGISPLALQGALAAFPQGVLTHFTVAYKFGLTLTGALVNSLLPLLVSWRNLARARLRQTVLVSLSAAGPAALVCRELAGHNTFGTSLAPAAIALLAGWAFVVPTTSVATQIVVRSGDFLAFRTTGLLNGGLTSAGIVYAVITRQPTAVALTLLVVQVAVSVVLFRRSAQAAEGWLTLAAGAVCLPVAFAPLLSIPAVVAMTLLPLRRLSAAPVT